MKIAYQDIHENLGALSSIGETGRAKGNPGTISTGKNDLGGKSYGIPQFPSAGKDQGAILKKYIAQSQYGEELKGLTPGSDQFDKKWAEIASRDPEGFAKDQHAFNEKINYTPTVRIVNNKLGIDPTERSRTLQSVLYSMGTQLGAGAIGNRFWDGFSKSLEASNKDPNKLSDAELISEMYSYKGSRASGLFANSGLAQIAAQKLRAFRDNNLAQDLLKQEDQYKASQQNPAISSEIANIQASNEQGPAQPGILEKITNMLTPSNQPDMMSGEQKLSSMGSALAGSLGTPSVKDQEETPRARAMLYNDFKDQPQSLIKDLSQVPENLQSGAKYFLELSPQDRTNYLAENPQSAKEYAAAAQAEFDFHQNQSRAFLKEAQSATLPEDRDILGEAAISAAEKVGQLRQSMPKFQKNTSTGSVRMVLPDGTIYDLPKDE